MAFEMRDFSETMEAVPAVLPPSFRAGKLGGIETFEPQLLPKPPASVRVLKPTPFEPDYTGANHRNEGIHVVAPRAATIAETCKPAADHAAPAARPSIVEQARPVELRHCEEFFFSFGFPELVRRSTHLIDQNSEFGDAYAFRCFATLGQVQQGMIGEEECELVDLLRDYFRACERPLATEGATVCRLFLKLIFGDLVKRIHRAEPGVRFSLDKSDPICGGAFAVLDGDFGRARLRFEAAAADPGSRSYAVAGIGLLKMFDSDLPGAVAEFERAGAADEDVLKLSDLLQH